MHYEKIHYIIPIILIFVLIYDKFSVHWNWFVGHDFNPTVPMHSSIPASKIKALISPIKTFYSYENAYGVLVTQCGDKEVSTNHLSILTNLNFCRL